MSFWHSQPWLCQNGPLKPCCGLFVWWWPTRHSQLVGSKGSIRLLLWTVCVITRRVWFLRWGILFCSLRISLSIIAGNGSNQAHNLLFPLQVKVIISLSQSTVASTYSYMNQSALISIIIGGTVAKQVQPLSLPDVSNVNIHIQGSLLASIQVPLQPPMPNAAFHNHFLRVCFEVQLITSAARCTDLHWIPWRCFCTQHQMRLWI